MAAIESDPSLVALHRLRAQVEAQHLTTLAVIEEAQRIVATARSDEPRWLSRREACAYLGLGLRALDTRLAAGDLPYRKVGKRVLISRHDLDRIGVRR